MVINGLQLDDSSIIPRATTVLAMTREIVALTTVIGSGMYRGEFCLEAAVYSAHRKPMTIFRWFERMDDIIAAIEDKLKYENPQNPINARVLHMLLFSITSSNTASHTSVQPAVPLARLEYVKLVLARLLTHAI